MSKRQEKIRIRPYSNETIRDFVGNIIENKTYEEAKQYVDFIEEDYEELKEDLSGMIEPGDDNLLKNKVFAGKLHMIAELYLSDKEC